MKKQLLAGLVLVSALGLLTAQEGPTRPKFAVKIQDEKAVVVDVEGSGGIDPTQRIRFMPQGNNFFININTMNNQTLHLSHFPNFLINGQFMTAGAGGRFQNVNTPLPKTISGKPRVGNTSTWITLDNLHITHTVELVAARAKKPGDKRLMNTVMLTYHIENKSNRPQTIGVRVYMDTYVIDNDGCLFAAPTIPNKLLDGMVLQAKTLPPYLQMLQRPDLKNPGFVAHLTLDMGSKFDKVQKLVLTRHGAGFNGWDMPAIASMGDSAIGVYWEAKELKPGSKREIAYAYGEGIAVPTDSEGRFQIGLGGSFEPGKLCTISALIADPAHGQSVALGLPAGMQLVEGKAIQPVAALVEGQEVSAVMWKARVLQPGEHRVQIRSSTGVTLAKIISVKPEE